MPFYMFKSGVCLTPTTFNKLLRDLLADIVKPNVSMISMHSYRAGIPSAISAFPDKVYVSEVTRMGQLEGGQFPQVYQVAPV
jgi:hypothetical protein